MNDLTAKSTVYLFDGQELLCDNSVDNIRKELMQTGHVKLILSERGGTELSVHETHVRDYVSTK